MTIDMFLIVSTLLFVLGIATFVTKKSAIAMLVGIELMINAAALNFAVFARYALSEAVRVTGTIWVLFIIVVAVAEAVVVLSVMIYTYKNQGTTEMDQLTKLHG